MLPRRNILMTGCCTGVGKTIRANLLNQGHDVVGVGKNGPDIKWNFGNTQHPDLWASELFAKHGPFDVLINNAGCTEIDFIENHDTERFEAVLAVNLVMPYALSKAFVSCWGDNIDTPRTRTKDYFGRIINTGSMGTKISMRGSPGYCASKAGLEALTKQMAKELAGRKPIAVFCIAPGTIEDTQMSEEVITSLQRTRGFSEEQARKYAMQSPMGRASTHDEVWRVFDFCVNQAPMYMSGNVFYMPGGMGV